MDAIVTINNLEEQVISLTDEKMDIDAKLHTIKTQLDEMLERKGLPLL